MFSAVNADVTQRLIEAKSIIDICTDEHLKTQENYKDSILLGNVYVLLYGALEYTLSHCVSRTIELLNNESLKLYDVQPTLWGLIYNADCMRMEQAGVNKKWENRYKLFHHLTKIETVHQIEDSLFPSSTGNIKETQIERIWSTFGLKSPMIEDGHGQMIGYFSTLSNGRMAVAHGREKASTIGGQRSLSEIIDLYNETSRYCSYLINCFSKYIQEKEYLQA